MADVTISPAVTLDLTVRKNNQPDAPSLHHATPLPVNEMQVVESQPEPGTNVPVATSEVETKKSKPFFSFSLMSSHIVMKKQTKTYKCDICGASYRHVFSLKRHFLRNHITLKYISHSDINNCKINVGSKVLEPQHDSDSDGKSTSSSCGSSNGASYDAPQQGTDKDVVSLSGLYRCNMCKDQKFDTRIAVRNHYQTHLNSSKSFPCETCKVTFPHKQALYRHLATHTGVNSIPCISCNEVFSSKAEYLKHASTHTDGRKCKYCTKLLSTKANRIRHERIHEGLKPYPCKHCSLEFGQSDDLKAHIRKNHATFYIFCSLCSSLFSSKTAMKKHLADRHQQKPIQPQPVTVPKTSVSASSLHSSPAKPSTSQSIQSISSSTGEKKTFSCPTCRKVYRSCISMLHHRRRVHPFVTSTRKVHKKTKYYTKSSRQRLLTRRRRSPQISEEDFYRSISDAIAENLLNFVDGKTSQLSLRQYNFSDQVEQNSVAHPGSWSTYNFPSSFDMDQALLVKGQEIKGRVIVNEPNVPPADGLMTKGLKSFGILDEDSNKSNTDSDSSGSDISILNRRIGFDYRNIDVEERKKLIGRKIVSVVVCSVCKEKFPNQLAFDIHCTNNHPNVQCSFVEIEGEQDSPPIVPEALKWHFLNPVGVFFECIVPPPVSDIPVISCTKCHIKFTTSAELHEHILLCGGSNDTQTHIRKANPCRKIKRTMKKRIDTARVKLSIFENDSSMTTAAPAVVVPNRARNGNLGRCLKFFKPTSLVNMRPHVGRPRSNLSLVCPHCKQVFRTKSMLKSHVNRCYKRLVMKNKCLKVTLKKVKNMYNKPQTVTTNGSDPVARIEDSIPIQVPSTSTSPPRIESPIGRLSPSLETLVNSIKEKLTAEELSPSHPTFSWMEDEAFLATPKASQIPDTLEGQQQQQKQQSNSHEKNEVPLIKVHLSSSSSATDQSKNKVFSHQTVKSTIISSKVNDNAKQSIVPITTKKRKSDEDMELKAKKVLLPKEKLVISKNFIKEKVILKKKSVDSIAAKIRQIADMASNRTKVACDKTVQKPEILPVPSVVKSPSSKPESSIKPLSAPTSMKLSSATSCVKPPAVKLLSATCVKPPSVKSSASSCVKPPPVKSPATSCVKPPTVKSSAASCVKPPTVKSSAASCVKPPTVKVLSIAPSSVQLLPVKSSSVTLLSSLKPLSTTTISTSQPVEEISEGQLPSSSSVSVPEPDLVSSPIQNETSPDVTNLEDVKILSSKGKQKCPYCMLDFAYLTTFQRHITACQEKNSKKDLEDLQQWNSPCLLLLPKRDEVEESMINLLRHQSRQSKMMKEAKDKNSPDVKSFQTYTCETCHRIFFSLFKLLQHRVVHKLQDSDDKNNVQKIVSENHDTPLDSPSGITTLLTNSPADLPGPSSASTYIPPPINELCNYQPIVDSAPSEVLHLQLPGEPSSDNHSGPSSAPISQGINNNSILEPPRSASAGPRLDISNIPIVHANIEQPEKKTDVMNFAFNTSSIMEEEEHVDDPLPVIDSKLSVPPSDDESSSIPDKPKVKKRKKVKSLVVRKRPLQFKKNLKERMVALKQQAQSSPVVVPEVDIKAMENTDVKSKEDDEISLKEKDTHVKTEVVIKNEKEEVTTVVESKPSTSTATNVDRDCPFCGKIFSSISYKKKHILLKHSDTVEQKPKMLKLKKIKKGKKKKLKIKKRKVLARKKAKITVTRSKSNLKKN